MRTIIDSDRFSIVEWFQPLEVVRLFSGDAGHCDVHNVDAVLRQVHSIYNLSTQNKHRLQLRYLKQRLALELYFKKNLT